MSDIEIIKIIFGSFLTTGSLVLFFLAYKLYYKYLIQEKRCTCKTKGIVKKYTLGTRGGEHSGICLPVVYYQVNGKEYKVVGPEYKSYKIINKSGPASKNGMEYNVLGDKLEVDYTTNSFVGIRRNPMATIFPVGTELDVYYDENKPKLAYVLRYCNRKSLFWTMFALAMGVLITDLCTLFLV